MIFITTIFAAANMKQPKNPSAGKWLYGLWKLYINVPRKLLLTSARRIK